MRYELSKLDHKIEYQIVFDVIEADIGNRNGVERK